MKTIAIAGTLDTKREENWYLAEKIRECGLDIRMIDLSTRAGKAESGADYTAEMVAEAGGASLKEIQESKDRLFCMKTMSEGAGAILLELWEAGKIDGFIAMGGGQGSSMAAAILRKLPVGMPKVLVSTILNLDGTAGVFEGVNDTLIMNSLVDIEGLNSVLKMVLEQAAHAVCGMAKENRLPEENTSVKKKIGISMWGVTTPCVNHLRKLLERDGMEVFVFHANGVGGNVMENLAVQGFFDLIMDLTLPELTMPLAGSPAPVLEERLLKAGRTGIPRILSVGGLDMVQFPGNRPLPKDKEGRKSYRHNESLTFVRSSAKENIRFAEEIADRAAQSEGETVMVLPLKGISAMDVEGGPLYDPEADAVLFETLKAALPETIPVYEYPYEINDRQFSEKLCLLAEKMLEKAAGGGKNGET